VERLDYIKLVGLIPAEVRQTLSEKLVDFILTSKNDEKMPSQLANNMLRDWQRDLLGSESGLAMLLEAAVLLEPEKVIGTLDELQLANVAAQIKQ
jgi:hypothetical protein